MRVRDLDLSDTPINAEHQRLGIPPVERQIQQGTVVTSGIPVVGFAMWLSAAMLVVLSGYMLTQLFSNGASSAEGLLLGALRSEVFWSAVLVGLIAQVIDGALGMAYGITSTTFLMAIGVSPAMASASVHVAEVFTTGVSGIAHAKLGNVNKSLFLRLLIPGIIGAVIGAYLVVNIDGKTIKPFISAYLLIMGLYIISKVFRKIRKAAHEPKHVAKLALFGGFVDTIGGGGWGPVVTTTLVGTGHDPRTTIGSVNFAEFFLTFSSAIAFTALVGFGPWMIVAGLVIGGLFAAPLAAYLCSRLPTRTLLVMVGSLITLVSAFNLYSSFA